jgi:hypothetical protein
MPLLQTIQRLAEKRRNDKAEIKKLKEDKAGMRVSCFHNVRPRLLTNVLACVSTI